MGIGLFPPRRHVIIEKFKHKKTSDKGLHRLDFMDFKYPEMFLVDSVSQITMTTVYVSMERQLPIAMQPRVEWSPVKFRIIECEGPGNGERLSAWINSHLFSEYYASPRATSVKLRKVYDDGSDEPGLWMLYGCVPTAVSEEKGSIFLEFQINHGVLNS